jgi:LmbE family N-acetylglucosaminyl deacetylase
MSAPAASDSILIFSPHPDDEVLGCSGLIQQALKAGAQVHVVFLTNGDGFRLAAEREFRQMRLKPDDYVRFGALRQKESRNALGELGLPAEDIQFLGYPDQGLSALWGKDWSNDTPYTSPYMRVSSSPFDLCYHPHATYSGASLLSDVMDVMQDYKPTQIYVTHPKDDHPDHSAASSFVALAYYQLKQQGFQWANNCILRYYIVHRGDWPVPQGLFRNSQMLPPAEMADIDTRWSVLPLSPEEEQRKEAAISAYASQTAMEKRFLFSFVRQNEIFGQLPLRTITFRPGISDPVQLASSSFPPVPVLQDPINDSLICSLQGGGDIRAVKAFHDSANLFLRVDTSCPVNDRVLFDLRMRYFGAQNGEDAGGTFHIRYRPNKAIIPAQIFAQTQGSSVTFSIPLRDIGYSHLIALNVSTSFMGLKEDITGCRFLRL